MSPEAQEIAAHSGELVGALRELGAWTLAIPPIAGLLVSHGAVWSAKRVAGPDNRIPDRWQTLGAMVVAGAACFALWVLLFAHAAEAYVVSLIVGVASPWIWDQLVDRVLGKYFPRGYAVAKVKRFEYDDDLPEKTVFREDRTTIRARGRRSRTNSGKVPGARDRRDVEPDADEITIREPRRPND